MHRDHINKAFQYLLVLAAAIVVCIYLTDGVNRAVGLEGAESGDIASGTPR